MTAIGPYIIERQVGRDAIVDVFLARDGHPSGTPVVVKRMRQDHARDPAKVGRFLEKARIASRFNHPNLVPVRDIVEDEVAMVMEVVDGWPLSDLIRRRQMSGRHIPYDIATAIIIEAADGLHFAHELCGAEGEPLGLVHGNVSPANVMVTHGGAVRLLNFGATASELSDVDALTYLTPEAVLDLPLDQRADIFGLGVVFYELLTLHPCFAREDPVETLDAILRAHYRPAQKWRDSLPNILRTTLERMLQRRAAHRYGTAAEVSIALWKYLADQNPVTAAKLQRFAKDLTDGPAPSERSLHDVVTVEMEVSWIRDLVGRSDRLAAPGTGRLPAPGNGRGAAAEPPLLLEQPPDTGPTLVAAAPGNGQGAAAEPPLLLEQPPDTGPTLVAAAPGNGRDAAALAPLRFDQTFDTGPTLDNPAALVDVLAAVDVPPLEEKWTVSSGWRLAVPHPRPLSNNEAWQVLERGVFRHPGDLAVGWTRGAA